MWWRIRDSNPGHKDYDSSALTDGANSPTGEARTIGEWCLAVKYNLMVIFLLFDLFE